MKKSTALILIIAFFSCQKVNYNDSKKFTTVTKGQSSNGNPSLDSGFVKTANRVDPDQPKQPTIVTLTTVVMYSTYTFKFEWVWNALPNGHGGGNYSISGVTTGGSGGNSQHTWQQGLVYWTNFPGSAKIYFTIKAKDSYWVAITNTIDHVQDDIIIDGVYNVNTGLYEMSVHVTGSHFIK